VSSAAAHETPSPRTVRFRPLFDGNNVLGLGGELSRSMVQLVVEMIQEHCARGDQGITTACGARTGYLLVR
jgi:hypothetical protein